MRITIPNAFPSFATVDDWARILRAADTPPRVRSAHWSEDSRRHRLPMVRCAAVRSDGKLCGRRLYPLYPDDGRWRYTSSFCLQEGHGTSSVSARIERVVLSAAAARFSVAALTGAVDRTWLDAAAARHQGPQLVRALEDARGRLEAAEEAELDRRRQKDGDPEDRRRAVARAQQVVEIARRALGAAEVQLAAFRADLAQVHGLAKADAQQVLNLATHIPQLLARAEAVPGMVRRIVAELVRTVHVRREEWGVLHVGIEYPSGVVEWQPFRSNRVATTDAERAWVLGCLADGVPAEQVAAERNAILAGSRRRQDHRPQACWGASQVRALCADEQASVFAPLKPVGRPPRRSPKAVPVADAGAQVARDLIARDSVWDVIAPDLRPSPRPDDGAQVAAAWDKRPPPGPTVATVDFSMAVVEPLPVLAARLGVEHRHLLQDALRGCFGPAHYVALGTSGVAVSRAGRDPSARGAKTRRSKVEESSGPLPGTLAVVSPAEAFLQYLYPAYARRMVAEAAVWPLDDVVSVAEAARRLGCSPLRVARKAGNASGVRADARRRRYVRWSEVASSSEVPSTEVPSAAAPVGGATVAEISPVAVITAASCLHPVQGAADADAHE